MRFLILILFFCFQLNAQYFQPTGLIDLSSSCIMTMENQIPCKYHDYICNRELDEAEICVRKCLNQYYKFNEIKNCIRNQCKSSNSNVQLLLDYSLICLNATKFCFAYLIIAILYLIIY
ncbi:hypothetical protein ABPG74_019826 [Tetrahymena malaccensis]